MNFARLIYTEGIKAYAKGAGISTDLDHPARIFSELAYITQVPKEFDFENPLLPPQFHYTGPFRDGTGRPKVDFPWDLLGSGKDSGKKHTDRREVLESQGQRSLRPIFRPAVPSAANLASILRRCGAK